MAAEPTARLAVLIDGDNISANSASKLFAEITKYGTASVRRIYGDWSKPNLNGWRDSLPKHAIQPVQQFANTGKNSTDITMVIDAMDLLYSGRFSGFCIVSSDCDFTRLAMRIREQDLHVYGIGEHKTPASFVNACESFFYLDEACTSDEKAANTVVAPTTAKVRIAQNQAMIAVRDAIVAVADDNGRANLSKVGQHLKRYTPSLISGQLHKFIRASDIADVERGEDGRFEFVRLKSASRRAA